MNEWMKGKLNPTPAVGGREENCELNLTIFRKITKKGIWWGEEKHKTLR